MNITWSEVTAWSEAHLLPIAINLGIALAVFVVGRSVARWLTRGAGRVMDRSRMDISLRKFLTDVMYAVLLVVVVTAALDRLGVETTAVIAVLGAAGLAIGLALQGSLSNFAAGVMLIVLRPYKVGDQVVIGKYTGKIESIKVFHTIMITADHREITIPNGKIISDPIENMTALGTRRIEIAISVAHGTNLADAKRWLEAVVVADKRVIESPAPTVDLAEVGHWGVKLYLRPWTRCDDYQEVAAATMERVKATLEQHAVKFSVALQ